MLYYHKSCQHLLKICQVLLRWAVKVSIDVIVADWQNYLRVQEGNTSSVNLINASVDYLVRLQESMSDFYWHYSSIEGIDTRGREAFMVSQIESNYCLGYDI